MGIQKKLKMPETTKKPKAAKKPAEHPTFAVMIAAAIAELKERKGSSRQAIEKYIAANYKVGPKYTGPMKQALKKGVEKGTLVHSKLPNQNQKRNQLLRNLQQRRLPLRRLPRK